MSKGRAAADQIVKLIVGAGQASPSPPVGPALGSKGVKSMDFCKVLSRSYYIARPLNWSPSARRMFEYLTLTHISGVQCQDSPHHPRGPHPSPRHCPPRPIFPFRDPHSHDLLPITESCGRRIGEGET